MEMTSPATPVAVRAGRSSWLANALILVLVLLFCMEGGSRAILSIRPLRRRATGIDNASYRLQWIQLRGEQREWTGPFAVYHPIRGWALKPNIRNMHVYDGTVLNTNSRGIRGLSEYAYERTPGKQRIVLVGDSYTFGSEVGDEDTFSHYLETTLPNTEVVNLGVQGYGHDQMLLYLREQGIQYRPDVVLVGFDYIDVYRNIENFFAYAKPEFEAVSGGLRLTNVPVPAPDRVLAQETWRPKALDLVEMSWQKLRWSRGWNEAEARTVTRLLLAEIARTARSAGATPVFVYLAVLDEIGPVPIYGVLANSPPVAEREQFLRNVCQEASVPCLFLGPRFREEAKRGTDLNQEHHWNKRAHELGGEEMRQFLLRSRLIAEPNESGNPAKEASGALR